MPLLVCTGINHAAWEPLVSCLLGAGFLQADSTLSTDANREGETTTADASSNALQVLEQSASLSAEKPLLLASCSLLDQLPNLPTSDHFYYLFFYSGPGQALSDLEYSPKILQDDIDERLQHWRQTTNLMQTFHQAHADQCVLINVIDALAHRKEFIEHISEALGVQIDNPVAGDSILDSKSSPQSCIFNSLCMQATRDMDRYDELYQDVKLTSKLLGNLSELNRKERLLESRPPFDAWCLLQQDQSELASDLEDLRSNCEQLASQNEQYKRSEDKLRSDKQALHNQIAELEGEERLSSLQIKRLKEELENLGDEKRQELARLKSALDNTSSDNEFLELQVNQLQEELENYLKQYQEEKAKTANLQSIKRQQHENVLFFAKANSATVTGSYHDDESSNLTLVLENLELGDGRKYEKLRFKLVEKGGHPGLEFRENSTSEGGKDYVQWSGVHADEYGPYLEYIPALEDQLAAENSSVLAKLNCSDSLLIRSISQCLAETLAAGKLSLETELSNEHIVGWKRSAFNLQSDLNLHRPSLNFDNVSLLEEKCEDNHEHLSLIIHNLLIGSRYFDQFRLKVAARDLRESRVFAQQLIIEFRQQDNGRAPLQVWPPIGQDEYGSILTVCTHTGASSNQIEGIELLSTLDRRMIQQLFLKLPELMAKLEMTRAETQRGWDQWVELCTHISKKLRGIDPNASAALVMPVERSLRAKARRLIARKV